MMPMGAMGGGHVEVLSPHGGHGGHGGPPHLQQGHSPAMQQPHAVVPVNGLHGGGGHPQQGTPHQNGVPAGGAQPNPASGPPQVSLAMLIDFMVQRTYHDLTVLAELLPRKTDMERKVEIFNFASRTRMLLIRLLALVKWASSASKVDKCVSIMGFCERSANVFMETADAMAKMARETLVRATLPNFHLPAAVEILTTGRYNRIPRCIRDRVVPAEPMTAVERRKVLLQLNQVIEQRLVSTKLPLRMRNVRVENGCVTFVVEHEFEVSLTLMGDGPSVPWRLLKINILVEDKETGDGKALMHSLQVRYLEQVVQSRLADNFENPLQDLYDTLHAMCQSLQLDVLHAQTMRLCRERLGHHVRVEEYLPGRCLTLSYWRALSVNSTASVGGRPDPNAELGYRFSVQVDPHDASAPLIVVHVPPLQPASEAALAERAVRCADRISMERLLVHTIHVRTRHRLGELKQEVQRRLSLGDVEATLHGSPALLSVPILQPCLRSEQLLVSVDTHTGSLLAHVPQYEGNPVTPEIQQTLNEDKSKLESLVSQLRHWMTKQRVHKTLQQLPATSHEMLPVLFDADKHPLKDLSQNRMYIRLHRHPDAVLIVEFHERTSNHCEIEYNYYFLFVEPASIEDGANQQQPNSPEPPKMYLKALSMVEFDAFLITHASGTQVDVQDLSEKIIGKRKSGGKVEAPIKRTKFPAYFISELSHAVSFADERLPFAILTAELSKAGVSHSGVQVEAAPTARPGLVVRLVRFPRVQEVPPPPAGKVQQQEAAQSKRDVAARLQNYLVSTCIRLVNRNGRFWKTEFFFHGSPIESHLNAGGSKTRSSSSLHFVHEIGNTAESIAATVKAIVQEWVQMAHLFELVCGLEKHLQSEASHVSHFVAIKAYDFKEVTLEYGPGRKQLLHLRWSGTESRFRMSFGGVEDFSGMCPHSLVRDQLEHHLNRHRDLALTLKIMHETFSALQSVCKLPSTPQLGINTSKVNQPIETFVVLPQSPAHVKIVFYNTYCLDVHIKAGGLVFIRDGAISLFDQRKVMDEMQPIPGLKTFLMKYVDENALQRRQSQTEDDHPPSPVPVGGDGDSGGQSGGLRFQAPQTPPSNPLTPASPHGAPSTQQQQFLQSPPSSVRQPSPANLPQPSPQQPSPAGGGGGGSSGFTAPSPANPIGSVGSPFPSAPSPGVGSPAPRPSPRQSTGLSPAPGGSSSAMARAPARLLPQRLWAGAHPTPLTSQAFDDMCRPVTTQEAQAKPEQGMMPPVLQPPTALTLAPIHRFFGSLFLRKTLVHMIRNENMQLLPSPDSSTVAFRMEGMTCKIGCFAANSFQSLHCKLVPDPPYMERWGQDDIMVLEKYFDTRVAVPPFRPNGIIAFVRILQCPLQTLQDMIRIIRLELMPELAERQGFKWTCRICLTVPPAAPHILPLGHPGLHKLKEKMLIFFNLIRANVKFPPGQEPTSVIVPLVYDIQSNQTTTPGAQKDLTPVVMNANQLLLRLSKSGQLNPQQCTIWPSLQDLLHNLSVPNDGPPHPMLSPQQQQPFPQQMMGPGGSSGGPPMHPGMMGQPMMRPQMGGGPPGAAGPGGVRPMTPMMNITMQQRAQMAQQQQQMQQRQQPQAGGHFMN